MTVKCIRLADRRTQLIFVDSATQKRNNRVQVKVVFRGPSVAVECDIVGGIGIVDAPEIFFEVEVIGADDTSLGVLEKAEPSK